MYKRQAGDMTMKQCAGLAMEFNGGWNSLSASKMCIRDRLSVSGRVRLDNSNNDYTEKFYATTNTQLTALSNRGLSVSYTHLDVYKRQI